MNLVNEGVLPPDELDDRDERREEQESARRRETVADIVAEIRAYGAQPPPRCMWLDIADRVETAARRERDHAIEHATRHAEAVARDNCRDCVHNPRGKNFEGGNAAAMREALVQCELFLGNVSRHGHPTLCIGDQCTACNGVDELRGMVVRALAKPPRQCDVGTAEEQDARFGEFCVMRRTGSCAGCPDPVGGFTVANGIRECALVWAQMPYKAEEGGL